MFKRSLLYLLIVSLPVLFAACGEDSGEFKTDEMEGNLVEAKRADVAKQMRKAALIQTRVEKMQSRSERIGRGKSSTVVTGYFEGKRPVMIEEARQIGASGNERGRYYFESGTVFLFNQHRNVPMETGSGVKVIQKTITSMTFDSGENLLSSKRDIDGERLAVEEVETTATLKRAKELFKMFSTGASAPAEWTVQEEDAIAVATGELESGNEVPTAIVEDVQREVSRQIVSTSRIKFTPGSNAGSVKGTLNGADIREYLLRASKRQTMGVQLESANGAGVFDVYLGGRRLAKAQTGWEGNLPRYADYRIRVYQKASAAAGGGSLQYTLQVSIR